MNVWNCDIKDIILVYMRDNVTSLYLRQYVDVENGFDGMNAKSWRLNANETL